MNLLVSAELCSISLFWSYLSFSFALDTIPLKSGLSAQRLIDQSTVRSLLWSVSVLCYLLIHLWLPIVVTLNYIYEFLENRKPTKHKTILCLKYL